MSLRFFRRTKIQRGRQGPQEATPPRRGVSVAFAGVVALLCLLALALLVTALLGL